MRGRVALTCSVALVGCGLTANVLGDNRLEMIQDLAGLGDSCRLSNLTAPPAEVDAYDIRCLENPDSERIRKAAVDVCSKLVELKVSRIDLYDLDAKGVIQPGSSDPQYADCAAVEAD